MRVSLWIGALLGCLCLCLAALEGASAQAPTPAGPVPQARPRPVTLILLRHAEKASAEASDPELSPAGVARALSLARLLAPAGVKRLFASEFRRTQATLEPLAAQLGLEIELFPARASEALLAELRALPPGSTAVVAGHSNTVPALLAALGAPLPGLASGPAAGTLGENEYGRLFVLTLCSGAEPSLLELAYGAP